MAQIHPNFRDMLGKLATPLNLEASVTQKILDTFVPLCSEAGAIARSAESVIVTDASQAEAIKRSGELLKQIGTVRKNVEKNRKAMKEEYLRPGQFIDATARTIAGLIDPVETRLDEQARIVERQKQEAERMLAEDRANILRGYDMDPDAYPLSLGKLTPEQWDDLADGARRRQGEAQKAEADRLAAEQLQIAETKRLFDENADLKNQRDAADQARAKAEQESQRLAADAKKKENDAKLAAARAARAPDKEKLLAFAQQIAMFKCSDLKSPEAQAVCGDCYIELAGVVARLKQKIDKL